MLGFCHPQKGNEKAYPSHSRDPRTPGVFFSADELIGTGHGFSPAQTERGRSGSGRSPVARSVPQLGSGAVASSQTSVSPARKVARLQFVV